MNLIESKYTQFELCHDMLATPEIIAAFDPNRNAQTAKAIAKVGRLLMTGEGSGRIFPSKHAIMQSRRANFPLTIHSEGGHQAQEYNLDHWAVFAASNSGKTSEVIRLFLNLRERGNKDLYALTAFAGSTLEQLSTTAYTLTCGPEGAVAATKSVIEQALFYHALVENAAGVSTLAPKLEQLAEDARQVLAIDIDPELTDKVANADTIYFAGRNDGVTEELTLKANEITRKKSDFLEGTYTVHGIEEVMNANDVVIWVDPYEDSEQKFTDVLVKGVGLTVIAIATHPTSFPTIQVPKSDLQSYVNMCAGWNLLVEVGVELGIDLDTPARARKVGNEFVG